jgi:predicted component of type VI protein secretion system
VTRPLAGAAVARKMDGSRVFVSGQERRRLGGVGGTTSYWLRYRGHRIPLRDGETVLGRSPYCSVVVNSPMVSRQHCALRLSSDGLEIVDLGSTNGTRVNDYVVRGKAPIKHGDTLRIGADPIEILEMDGSDSSPSNLQTYDKLEAVDGPPSSNPEPVTLTGTNTLDLLEALVDSKGTPDSADRLSRTVQRIVNEWVESAGSRNRPIPHAIATRLAGVADRVSSWFVDGELDEWRRRVRKGLRIDKR